MKKYNSDIIQAKDKKVYILDQTKLPHKQEIIELKNYKETTVAIKDMKLRGAGTIGVAAGFAMAQAFTEFSDMKQLEKAKQFIEAARPTAQNLFYSTNKVYNKSINSKNPPENAWITAYSILEDDIINSRKMGLIGAKLIRDGFGILTHCNAGKLAIQGWGSALAPIYIAKEQGKKFFVFVDETRPRLQGALLTAWELSLENIKHAIIVDNAAGYYMQKGKIDIVFVGADRIAKNGDIANKIGTYEKAVLAKENKIQFYVVAPSNTIDFNCLSGSEIKIEERAEFEIKEINNKLIANETSSALNPAFDITPAKYITGIITEKGIFKPEDIKDY